MIEILQRQKIHMILGVLGLAVLGIAGAGKFPYLETSPFDFSLPTYADY